MSLTIEKKPEFCVTDKFYELDVELLTCTKELLSLVEQIRVDKYDSDLLESLYDKDRRRFQIFENLFSELRICIKNSNYEERRKKYDELDGKKFDIKNIKDLSPLVFGWAVNFKESNKVFNKVIEKITGLKKAGAWLEVSYGGPAPAPKIGSTNRDLFNPDE